MRSLLMVLLMMLSTSVLAEEPASQPNMAAAKKPPVYHLHMYPDFVTNLSAVEGIGAYVQVRIVIVTNNQFTHKFFESNEALFRDKALQIFNEALRTDFITDKGKAELSAAIKLEFTKLLHKFRPHDAIKEIMLKKIIIE